MKSNMKSKLKNDIEKYSKQEQIIFKVLDRSNNEDNKHLFEKPDELIAQDLEFVKTRFDEQKKEMERFKRIKDNYSDFDYFASNACF